MNSPAETDLVAASRPPFAITLAQDLAPFALDDARLEAWMTRIGDDLDCRVPRYSDSPGENAGAYAELVGNALTAGAITGDSRLELEVDGGGDDDFYLFVSAATLGNGLLRMSTGATGIDWMLRCDDDNLATTENTDPRWIAAACCKQAVTMANTVIALTQQTTA